MVIRGAPAIGVAAAMGLALGARSVKAKSYEAFSRRFKKMADRMAGARPTAVNLQWAVDRMSSLVQAMGERPVEEIIEALRAESEEMLNEDIAVNRRMGKNGLELVPRGVGHRVRSMQSQPGALGSRSRLSDHSMTGAAVVDPSRTPLTVAPV